MSDAGTRSTRPIDGASVLAAQVDLLQADGGAEEPEVLRRAVELAVDLTGSECGYAFYVDPGAQSVSLAAKVPDGAQEPDRSVWRSALGRGRPQTVDPVSPAGAPTTYLSVPVGHGGDVPLVLAVGRAAADYDRAAVAATQAVADSAWQVVQRARELQSLRDRLELLSGRQPVMGVATWEWNPVTDEVVWDPAVSTVLPGLCADCGSWQPLRDMLDEEGVEALFAALANTEAFSVEVVATTADGRSVRLLVQGDDGSRPGAAPGLMRGTIVDVSVVAALEDAHRRATHDVLTGLPNRAWLLDELDERVARPHHRREDQFAVFFIDLDDFKAVNDEYGHIIGDQVLAVCARRLQQVSRDRESVARFGGDEFVLIQDGPFTWQSVESLAHRIRSEVGKPVRIGTHLTQVGASIGIALCASEQWSSTELLRQADEALLAAKKSPWGVVIRDGRCAWES